MRGLAFPSNVVFERETSHEYGSPFGNGDNIPIDPALGGPAIDPAIMGESSTNIVHAQSFEHSQLQHSLHFPQPYSPQRQYSQEPRQYSQGPQGDPFAPQPLPAYLPIQEVPSPPPKPVKKKRRPRREEECGFCQGNDSRNKAGEPEMMVTCDDCGRSGHPSCMDLREVSEVVRSYPWKCIECKICEICQEKGDDERILFCDFCDRGWHMDCLPAPLEESPPGRWHCPICPPINPDDMFLDAHRQEMECEMQRETSVASTSQSPNYSLKGRGGHGTKDEDLRADDWDVSGDGPGMLAIVKKRGRPKSIKKGKVSENLDDEHHSSPIRPVKRMRFRVNSPGPLPRIRLRLPSQKGKGRERDEEEEYKKGLFDDILSVNDRDTAKTSVEYADKQRFERSRFSAEEKLAPPRPPPPAPPALDISEISTPGPSSRPLRSSFHPLSMPISTPASGLSASPAPSTPVAFTKVSESSLQALRIRTIRFGQFDIQTWYDAPFPEEYANIPDGRLWICEFCLKYMKSRFGAVRHRMKCKARHPPGDEIYRDGAVSIFEVDGRKNKIYCQNLCLLSKMFLDHKSLFYDVEPFLFYVMTEVDDVGARFVGYFSKEKRSPKDYNVSCIMTLPVRQRQGWGNLLIDFSYLLSKKEQRLGSPEKPLSGLGALGYKNYWTLAVMRCLQTIPDDHPRLEDISTITSMTIEDVYTTLTQQSMIFTRDITPPPVRPSPGQSIKFPKGRKNGIARRHLQRTQTQDEENSGHPFIAPKQYEISWDRSTVDQFLAKWETKGYLKLKPEKLNWSPFLLARMKTDGVQGTPNTLTTDVRPEQPTSSDGVSTLNGDKSNSLPSLFVDDEISSPASDLVPTANDSNVGQSSTSRASRSPSKTSRLEEDPGPVRTWADSPSIKKGSLRSQSASVSTSSRLKTRSKDSAPGRPGSARSIRSSMRTDKSDHSVAGDATLIPEERRPSRVLRARSDAGSLDSVIVDPSSPNPRVSSPRKRRRVESSPEGEVSRVSPTKSMNGKSRPLPRPSPVHTHKPSRLPNGSEPEQDTPQLMTAVCLSNNGTLEDIPVKAIVQTEEMTPNHDDRAGSLEVKSEDCGTPLTSLTSRRSVTNDGEVFHIDINAPPDDYGKEAGGIYVDRGAELVRHEAGPTNYDEGDDADADGEYEEDAEGEPDVELLEAMLTKSNTSNTL